MSQLAEVERVILAVYSARGEHRSREEALKALQDFAGTGDAWHVFLELLSASRSQNVQFFAGIQLYAKVQKEWLSLHDEGARQAVLGRVLGLVRAYVEAGSADSAQGDHEGRKTVERLCLILARITVLTPEALDGYLAEIWTMTRAATARALFVGSELLKALPEEKEAAAGCDQSAIEAKLVAVVPPVMEIISQLLPKVQVRALECVQAWASAGLDVPALARFGVLRPVLQALSDAPEEAAVEAAASALTACVQRQSAERRAGAPEPPATLHAFDEVVDCMLRCRARLGRHTHNNNNNNNNNNNTNNTSTDSENDGEEGEAHREVLALCKVVVVVAEDQLPRIVRAETPSLLALVDMVMAVTAHPSRGVAIHATEFWLQLQDFGMDERHESLREGRFLQLLEVLLSQCRLNADAGSGAEADVDDEVVSFRLSVKDVVQVTTYCLGRRFSAGVLAVMQASQDWRAFESTLFVASASSSTIAGPEGAKDPSLHALLAQMPEAPLLRANGATLRAAVLLSGDFAASLARMDRSHIERHLEVILLALPFSTDVSRAAGASFRSVCIACRLELAMHPEVVQGLAARLEGAHEAFPTAPDGARPAADGLVPLDKRQGLPLEARTAVVEGITRVASCMQPVERCTETLVVLLTPVLARLRSSVDAHDAEGVASQLKILCASVKAVTVPQRAEAAQKQAQAQTQTHPVEGILAGALPLLERISASPSLRLDGDVVDALYDFISTSLVSAKEVLRPHLESLLSTAVAQFRLTFSPCCITCIGKAVEMFAARGANQDGFVRLYALLTDAVLHAFRERRTVDNPAIATNFFETARNFLLFCPAAVVQALDVQLQLVAQAICVGTEVDSVRAAAGFLLPAVTRLHKPGESNTALQHAFAREGHRLVEQTLLALADQMPPEVVPKLSSCLAELNLRFTHAVRDSVYQTLVAHPDKFKNLPDNVKEAILEALPRAHAAVDVTKNIFVAFSKTCRKEEPPARFYKLLVEAQPPPPPSPSPSSSSASTVVDLS